MLTWFRQLLIFNLLDVRQFPCLVEQWFFRAVKAEENFEFSVGASGDPVRPTYGLAWSQSLAQSENLLPEPELPLIHLDSPYNREGQLPRPASPPAFPPAVSHSR
jgi:hypothetical protein